MLRKEHKGDPDRSLLLDKGDDLVARFIGGATVGALAGGAFTAGGGIVRGAVVGGLVGAVVPEVLSSFNGSRNGHENGHES
jgi:outer membrane lipoprotein SlyB